MRILFATNIPFPEGRANTRRIMSVAREMARQGHDVCLVLPYSRTRQPHRQEVDGVKVHICHVPLSDTEVFSYSGRVKLSVQLLSRLKWWKALWDESSRRSYDWMYLYQPGADSLCAAGIARIFDRKIVSEFVDALTPAEYSGPVWRTIYQLQVFADRIVPRHSHLLLVISTALRDKYQARYPSVPVMILPTLVDTDRFTGGDRNRFRHALGIGERPTVVFTGSFVRTEGLRALCAAFAQVIEERPDAMLVIAGGSLVPESDDVNRLLDQHHLRSNAHYVGMLPERDVIDLQACADVLVMPKTDDPVNHAGLATKLGEYLSSGNAVVASDVGDVKKYLVDHEHAMLVPPGDVAALAAAILYLVSNPDVRQKIGKSGRDACLRSFSVRDNVEGLLHAFGGTVSHSTCVLTVAPL